MSYQRFKKGGRVAKSPFLPKIVQKSLNKKMKTDRTLKKKATFFESSIAQKRFIFWNIVMFHMVNVKRVVL